MRVLIATLALLAALVPASAQAAVPTCQTPDLRVARTGVQYSDPYSCTGYTSLRPVGTPQHLQVQASWPGLFVVQAEAGYTGPASFTFVANNIDGDSAPVTARYEVGPDANRPPRCSVPATPIVRLGETRAVPFSCVDPESDPLTADQPTAGTGTASLTPGTVSVVYRAPPSGATPLTDTVGLRVGDGRDVISATASVDVEAVDYNTAPRCASSTDVVVADEPTQIGIGCSDAEDDPITVSIVSDPAHGTLTQNTDGRFVYRSVAGYTGPDSVTYSGDDAHGGLTTATAAINVTAPPAPSCSPGTPVTVRPGRRAFFTVSCFPGLRTVTQQVIGIPSRGTVTGSDGYYAYDAGPVAGSDSITVRTTAGGAPTDVVVPVTVTPTANLDPHCTFGFSFPLPPSPTTFTLRATGTRRFSFTCVDSDGDPMSVHLDAPAHGRFTTLRESTDDSGTLAYTAVYTPSASGDDTVAVQVSDGHGGTAQTNLTFHVQAASTNTPPACAAFSVPTGPRVGEPLTLTVRCQDNEADPITYAASASGATVTSVAAVPRPDGDDVTITLLAGTTAGPASLTLTPSDAETGAAVTAPFTVRPPDVNFAPTCFSPSYSVNAGKSIALGAVLPCSDADRDTLTATLTGSPSHGVVDADNVYHAADGYSGNDRVVYAVTDGHGGTATATLQIYVTDRSGTPTTVVDGSPSLQTHERRPTLTFHAPDHPAATFECLLAGPSGTGAWEACVSPLTLGPLADGYWTLSVRAVDGGVKDPDPAYIPMIVDATPPEPPILTEEPHGRTASQTATVRFEGALTLESYECRLDAGAWTPCEPPQHLSGLAPGTHAFAVRTVDFFGNRSEPTTAAWSITSEQPETTPTAAATATQTATATATSTAPPAQSATAVPSPSVTTTPHPTVVASPTVTPFPTVAIGDPPARDATPPRLAVNIPATTPKRVAARGLTVPVGCDEACAAAATVTISRRTAKQLGLGRHAMTIGRSPVTDATQQPLAIHFSKRVAKAIRKARAVTLSVTVVAIDAAGNATQHQTRVSLRR